MKFRLISVMVATAFFAGCGPGGPERVDVTGTFKYAGKDVEDGALELIPVTSGAMQPISVNDGKFSATGQYGVLVGDYKVVFHAYKRRGYTSKEQEGGDGPPILEMMSRVELLPPKYSTEASTETLNLKTGQGSVSLQYDLK